MALFSKARFKKAMQTEAPKKQHTVLIVDDEGGNLSSLEAILEQEYNVLTAQDGKEALDLVKKETDPRRIHLIMSDQRMPNMQGVDFLKQTIPLMPHTIRILMTGFTDIEAIIDAINDGQIYKYVTKPFDPKDLLITIKRALETYALNEEHEKSLKTFEKFVPKQFLSRIAESGIENIEFGKAKSEVLTILFSDIRSFTTLSENISPQETLNFLNGFFKRMNEPIHHHHGFIDKFIGDAIMAIFDDRGDSEQVHAARSVQAAIEMQTAIEFYNQHRQNSGYRSIAIGIGIHSGDTVIGTVGSEERMSSTAIGDAVNIASRIENLTKYYKVPIIISSDTYQMLQEYPHILCRELGNVRIKGKAQTVKIFEVFNNDSEAIQEKKQHSLNVYQDALNCFKQGQLEQARLRFQECLTIFPEDHISQMYIERCDKFEGAELASSHNLEPSYPLSQ